LVRGRILALLPFYLIAVVCLVWGFNTAMPKEKGTAWYFMNMRGSWGENGETWNTPQPIGGDKDEAVNNPEFTTGIDGKTFWGYVLQQCTGIAMAPAIEKFYWMIIFPIGDGLGFEMTPRQDFSCGRIISLNGYAEILENLIRIITTIFFLGVIADIAATVQKRIQTGQTDLDLTKDHGVALLTAVHSLSGREEAKVVRGSWQMMRQINGRAVEGLIGHLHHEGPQVRAAAAWALGELGETSAGPALVRRYEEGEERTRAKAAMLDAMARLAPLAAQPHLRDALRGQDLVLAHTALAAQADIVARLRETSADASAGAPEAGEEKTDVEKTDEVPAPGATAIEQQQVERVRAALAAAVRTTLIDALDAPADPVRRRVVRQLAALDPDTTSTALLERLSGKDAEPRWTEGALLALGRLAWPEAESQLIQHAGAKSPVELRVAALRSLGWHHSEAGLKVLRDALADSDAAIRRAACMGLGRRGNATDLSALVKTMQSDSESADVRLAAVRALRRVCARLLRDGQSLGANVVTPLREIAANPEDSLLRDQACYGLAELRDADAVDILIGLLPDPEAADALGMLGASDLARPLEAGQRKKVVQQLKAAADRTVSHPVMSRERNAPIEALGHNGRDASPTLQDLYRSQSRIDDRRVIAASLALAADPRAANDPSVKFLIHVFDSRDRISAEWLCPALAQTRHPDAARELRKALQTSVAPLAARALGDMHDPESLADLLQLANTSDEPLRDAIFSALRRLSADPEFSADISRGLQRQVRVMGARAANVMRFMVRMAGSLLTLDDDADPADHSPSTRSIAAVAGVRPEELLAEFG
ncbi:MAG: HEAT repeat domain-containing protein, partial [Planctomycetota bacterium]